MTKLTSPVLILGGPEFMKTVAILIAFWKTKYNCRKRCYLWFTSNCSIVRPKKFVMKILSFYVVLLQFEQQHLITLGVKLHLNFNINSNKQTIMIYLKHMAIQRVVSKYNGLCMVWHSRYCSVHNNCC